MNLFTIFANKIIPIMKDESLIKLQYLLEGLTGKKVPMDILKSIENEQVGIKKFQRECNQQMSIPFPHDPRADKYKDIPLYSSADLEQLFKQKFPGQLTLTLKGIDAELLAQVTMTGYIDEELDAIINDKPLVLQDDQLDVKLTVDTERALQWLWPDVSYQIEEMDEWLNDTLGEHEKLYESLCKDSRSSNFVKQHPDLKDGRYTFYLCEENMLNQTMIEGIPFPQVAHIIKQQPDITTAQLKAYLRYAKKYNNDIMGRISDIIVKTNDGVSVRYKVDGVQQMFQKLTPDEQKTFESIDNKGAQQKYLTELLATRFQNLLVQQEQQQGFKR